MSRSNPLYLLAILGLVFSAIWMTTEANQKDKEENKKVVFIAGNPSHRPGEHEHRAGCMLLAEHLRKAVPGIEAIVVENGWPKDESVFENADAVVIYADGGGRHPSVRNLDKLKELVDKGTGIGHIHYAVEVPKGESGNAFLDAVGGFFETHWSVNPHWTASFVLPDHPIANGVADYEMLDEWYYHMRFRDNMEGVTPILSALPPEESLSRKDGPHSGNPAVRKAVLEDKKPQTVMWAYDRPEQLGAGRGFGFTGGHFHKNWQDDSQRRVVLNAIAWIAGLEIPEEGLPTATPTDEEMMLNMDKKTPRGRPIK